MTTQVSQERRLYDAFAPGVAYIAVEDSSGRPSIGTCFHIGHDVFVTARHVVEHHKITKIATTYTGVTTVGGGYGGSYTAGEWKMSATPFFHPKPEYDLAALKLQRSDRQSASQIPFFDVRDDRPDELMLRKVVIMGYPPIPGSREPVLVCARAEVNASFVTYFDTQRIYIVSCLARGGFSGGPALTPPHHCLGIVTRAVLKDSLPEELGFMAVVGPLPILELLDYHHIMPQYLRDEIWKPHKRGRKGT